VNLQSAIQFLFPPRCLSCGSETASEFGVCGTCWRDLPIITGPVCDACGTPLPGQDYGDFAHCDICLAEPRPWVKGRAALTYEGTAKRLIMGLKYGDRTDIARPMAQWMAEKSRSLIEAGTVVVPVPLHWRRLLSRRFNQAALLGEHVAAINKLDFCPDLLKRARATVFQEKMTIEQRFENQRNAIEISSARHKLIVGKPVLLIDDVMTSGATLGACAKECYKSGAKQVNILVLARVARST